MPLQWRNQIRQNLEEGAGKRCWDCGYNTDHKKHGCQRVRGSEEDLPQTKKGFKERFQHRQEFLLRSMFSKSEHNRWTPKDGRVVATRGWAGGHQLQWGGTYAIPIRPVSVPSRVLVQIDVFKVCMSTTVGCRRIGSLPSRHRI